MILKGHHVSKSKTETVHWSAEVDTETGRKRLTGDYDGELEDESISEQFVSEDGLHVYDVCQECYSHIKINGKCVGKKNKQCYLGVSMDW
jgi:hypothetical protein